MDNATFDRPVTKPDIEVSAVGESWAEVESELAMPVGALCRTVNIFNQYAAKGQDPAFHKATKWLRPLLTPPFAALNYCAEDYGVAVFTLGGLDTLPTGEVLDADGNIICGLYAAGRTACGLPRWGEGYSSGMSIGDSTFFGRQAGLTAANHIAKTSANR